MMDIKELAKKLCDESGCHHKCKEIDECVVMEEAELLINQDKSNNFDVKSNNELFKQALVEGLTNKFDKIIEQEKQIEEMAKVIFESSPLPEMWMSHARISAEALYNEGWRKQSEGEWIKHCNTYECSVCKEELFVEYAEDYDAIEDWNLHFCPFCGAKMKGGEE